MVLGQMIGRIISHYRIIERLGAGGMGVVFRAHDEFLDRDVAIKFLPPGLITEDAARKRFLREALTLARLHHPNIGTIYEFGSEEGSDYLVMECIPGATLAERLIPGPIAEKEVIAIASQIAAALEEAHEQGVIHCDLKPANVMITPKRQVKILDFGVARLAQKFVDESATTTSPEDTSRMMGTLPYMAPEQLFGEATDGRTDIHAFGALLYEMVTGRRAFPQQIVPRISEAILHRLPTAPTAVVPDLSPELERIILKCLEKSPEDRYQSARELCVDLRRLASPSTGTVTPFRPPSASVLRRAADIGLALLLAGVVVALAVPQFRENARQFLGIGAGPAVHSLAVLPVENLSGDPSQEYVADGLTSVLTGDLAEIHALKVISPESVMPFKGQRTPLEQVTHELNVDAVIVATFRRSGNNMNLTVRLLRSSRSVQLWAQSYDFPIGEVPGVFHEIVSAVSRRASIPLTPAERLNLTVNHQVDPTAEEAYLQGRACLAQPTEDSLEQARACFERSALDDTDYAPAYAGLAESYVLCSCQGRSHISLMMKAKEAALHALELDENLAEPHAALGFIEMAYDYDWLTAQRELKRAIALDPNSAHAHHFYGEFLIETGQFREGIVEMRRAAALDPLSVPMNASVGLALYYARDDEAAVEQFQKTLRMDRKSGPALIGLGLAYLQMARYQQAAAQFQKAVSYGYDVPLSTAQLAQAYALMGSKDEARYTVDLLTRSHGPDEPPAYALAQVYAGLGDKAVALKWLERATQARDADIRYLKVDPSLDPLRGDPRFQALLSRVGIP
ncbi:MAG: protein kinase [Acidobacteriota bacterium]|nr:protein kinase [Acidobacteriota bacterium]